MIISPVENLWDTNAPRLMAEVIKQHDMEINIVELDKRSLQNDIEDLEIENVDLSMNQADEVDYRFSAALKRVLEILDPLSDEAIIIQRGLDDVFGG